MKCHICENETDFYCRDCEEPVCEDCCVVHTYENQIDYTLCQECGDSNDVQYAAKKNAEYKREQDREAKKEKRKKKRFENYHKPKNVKKRLEIKKEKARLNIEHNKKIIEETFKIVNSMFKSEKAA